MKTWLIRALALLAASGTPAADRVEFVRDFAPSQGWVQPPEQPHRQDLCLNGRWQFQPVPVPRDWQRNTGTPPHLPQPDPNRWESTPIKIPSPWNVNTWGAGRDVGAGTRHPYWPSSVYYPSYPAHWDGVEMGWLHRTFRVPASWTDRRIVLHFEAVGGHAEVFVNGHLAGEHFDRFLPFELDITDLAHPDRENELLVGVRSMRLFDQRSATYKHMRTPYPPGSNTDNLSGIWQDVFLLGLPVIRVTDVFVQPWVDRDILEAQVTLRNDSPQPQSIELSGIVHPWVNLAGTHVLDAPEPQWRLDPPVLDLPSHPIALQPGESRTLSLHTAVSGRLALWSPDTPNLYGLVLTTVAGNTILDRSYTRFGWRQCQIVGPHFLLNGRKIQMFGDLLHPFGPFVNSRRYVWAWYRMIKDMHGNAVRPHAQPHPRHYLDLADEMGLLVLDETALFGSSLQLNFESPIAWDRFAEHYDNLILRDRNHPGVFGWSWGNELFAIFIYDDAITDQRRDLWYGQLAGLGLRGPRLDPTRDWYSCDGDEDLRGTMPVWNKHFGHGLPPAGSLPDAPTKPLMIGESGGTYYARPQQLAVFNGDRAYASYLGRNEALAMDLYDNIVHLARPGLAFFSPAETAWFGIEHLNLGYHDFNRLPNATDGVWLQPFVEGRPGVQPERIPPYVCTFNPGWDPSLPLYRPLPLFEAQKAAQAPVAPEPCPWSQRPDLRPPQQPPAPTTIDSVAFLGALDGRLFARLQTLGVPIRSPAAAPSPLLLVEAESFTDPRSGSTEAVLTATLENHGTVWVLFREMGTVSPAVGSILPAILKLTPRTATALVPSPNHPWTAGLSLAELCFAEDKADQDILKCGLEGPLVDQARIVLDASNTDWSLFNNTPENAKCAAVVLYEHLVKPSGAAWVTLPHQGGTLAVSTLDYAPRSPAHDALWRTLFSRLGVRLKSGPAQDGGSDPAPPQHNLLLDRPPTNAP